MSEANTNSDSILARATVRIPGGVNSPVRAFAAVGGRPPFIASASGANLVDADGNQYLDYVGSWGPAILGHADPDVIDAVCEVAAKGLSFGAPTELEVEFAERLSELYPALEMMRCVSSGTEATMSALRAARGFTGRDVIVKFAGAYHGHSDSLLVKAGSGAATFGAPDSAGVPAKLVEDTLVARYNDLEALKGLFDEQGPRIAAVIVEPVAGNMGCVPPAEGFLAGLIELCERSGSIAIFDEVMTGCRVAAGGAQELFSVRPHLVCLGKIVGGGMPLAVYGGQRQIMERIAPLGAVYQAGTLSGNPVAVTAGLVTLSKLDSALYAKLERLGARLEQGLNHAIQAARVVACVQRVGSMITLFFHGGPVRSWDEASQCNTERFALWHRSMLAQGVYWPPAQFEAAFISGAHTDEDIDRTLAAAKIALEKI
jgi:glutamate-1-semialdehyde 2,1-aminomutase